MRNTITVMMVLLGCYAFAQQASTYNEGVLYVSPQVLMTVEGDLVNKQEGSYNNDGEVLLRGDFENQGETGFLQEGGITRFEGYDIQEIKGDAPAKYYNVLFDNDKTSSPFHLKGWMEIYGEVSFTRGIVDNLTYEGSMIFNKGSDHFNTSNASYVEGFVDKEGDEDFIFPIGEKGHYRYAAISAPGQSTDLYSSKYYLDNSDANYPHQSKEDNLNRIDDQEYWIIDPMESPAEDEDLYVTLTYDAETTPEEIREAADNGNLVVVRWDEETNTWVNEAGTIDTGAQSITSQPVGGFGVFTLGIANTEDDTTCDLVIYNAVTPNDDGINDFFRIEWTREDCAKKLHVQIFNRWGVKVFETDDYGSTPGDRVFDGWSTGRATVKKNKNRLPTGTYFYVLEYTSDGGADEEFHREAGYLYLSGN